MNKLIRCPCLLGLCLLAAMALLPGGARAATTLTITSNYGNGLNTVAVKDVPSGKPLQICNFVLQPNAPCVIQNVTTGDAIDDVKNLSQIWAVARVLVKLALQDDQPSQR